MTRISFHPILLLLTSGYWAYIMTSCNDLNTSESRKRIYSKTRWQQIDQWEHSMKRRFDAWQQARNMNQNMTQKTASSALPCTAQIQRQNEQITTKTMQQHYRKWRQTNDTDSRNGQNGVQIKYTTTRTCEIQTIEPNRTQNGDKTEKRRKGETKKRKNRETGKAPSHS